MCLWPRGLRLTAAASSCNQAAAAAATTTTITAAAAIAAAAAAGKWVSGNGGEGEGGGGGRRSAVADPRPPQAPSPGPYPVARRPLLAPPRPKHRVLKCTLDSDTLDSDTLPSLARLGYACSGPRRLRAARGPQGTSGAALAAVDRARLPAAD